MKRIILPITLCCSMFISTAQSLVRDTTYHFEVENNQNTKILGDKIYTYRTTALTLKDFNINRYNLEDGTPDNTLGSDTNLLIIPRQILGQNIRSYPIFRDDSIILFSHSNSGLQISRTSISTGVTTLKLSITEPLDSSLEEKITSTNHFLKDNHLEGFYLVEGNTNAKRIAHFCETDTGINVNYILGSLIDILNVDSSNLDLSSLSYFNGYYYGNINTYTSGTYGNLLFRINTLFELDTSFASSGFLSSPFSFFGESSITEYGNNNIKFADASNNLYINKDGSIDSSRGFNGIDYLQTWKYTSLEVKNNAYLSFNNHYLSEDKYWEWNAVLKDSFENTIQIFGENGYWPNNLYSKRIPGRVKVAFLLQDKSVLIETHLHPEPNLKTSIFHRYLIPGITLGQKNQTDAIDHKLYPNPVRSALHIKTKNKNLISYKIYASDGQLIMGGDSLLFAIDVSEMNSGIYFIILSNQNGESTSTKFIKQ